MSEVSDLVKTAISNNSVLAENKDIKIISDLKTDENKTIQADFDKTVWVLNNFLTNAIQHSEAGQEIIVSTAILLN